MTDAEPVRILIADDHRLFLEGLEALLSSLEGMSVVGRATNGEEAVARAAELQPDVILMDISMPELSGLEATRRILQRSPHVAVLLGLIAAGRGNAEIARKLDISSKTVRNHVSNIFSKLQVVGRAEAIARAKEAGWG